MPSLAADRTLAVIARSNCNRESRMPTEAEVSRIISERDGYRNAYEILNAEVGHIRSERDGYRNAYRAVDERYSYLRAVAAPIVRETVRPEIAGKPSVFVVTLPKSGTVFISHSLRSTLDYDFTSVLVTPTFPKNIVWQAMADDFMRGGLVSASHMQPDAENLSVLRQAGVRKCLLHVRDPRAALASWYHFRTTYGAEATEVERLSRVASPHSAEFRSWPMPRQMDHYIETFYRPCLGWLTAWMDVADNDPSFDVLVKTHEQLAEDDRGYMRSALGFYGLDAWPAVVGKSKSTHYRSGSNDGWRSDLTDEQTERVNGLLPRALADRFGWKV